MRVFVPDGTILVLHHQEQLCTVTPPKPKRESLTSSHVRAHQRGSIDFYAIDAIRRPLELSEGSGAGDEERRPGDRQERPARLTSPSLVRVVERAAEDVRRWTGCKRIDCADIACYD